MPKDEPLPVGKLAERAQDSCEGQSSAPRSWEAAESACGPPAPSAGEAAEKTWADLKPVEPRGLFVARRKGLRVKEAMDEALTQLAQE
eukprot:10472409-Alexandrium_andersonii.AAC.1